MSERSAAYGLIGLVAFVACADTFFLFQQGTGIRQGLRFRMLGSVDGYSEGVVVRAADRFVAEGFAVTWALPDPGYGGRFPDMGIIRPSGIRSDDSVYHGDPPGPHWIAGLGFKLWGGEHLGRTRLIPVASSIAAAIYLARALAMALGNPRALFVFAACAACPMFTNMSDSLYYYGYAHALLMAQIAVLLGLFAGPGPVTRAWPRLVALGAIGLAQGFLSYAYAGVVALAAIPIALLIMPPARPIPRALLFGAVAVPAVAFVSAHLIHFGQSVLYFGSIRETLDEYAFRSNKTYWVESQYPAVQGHAHKVLLGFRMASIDFVRQTHLFAPTSLAILGMLAAALVLRRAAGTARPRWRWELASRPTRRRLLGLLAAVAVGTSWIVLKPNHAIAHLPVVGRTFFLPYFACALFLALTVRLQAWRLRRPVPGATRATP
ncbi:MAG: hypothetical protein U0800_17110 [Isosphaeraceae bacterium]